MKQHYGLNATVIGHNIPGVVEYDPIISAQSFRTIDDIFRKMGLLKPSKCTEVWTLNVRTSHARMVDV